eukprot:4176588-Pleurochrysis_carterae.AAC.1
MGSSPAPTINICCSLQIVSSVNCSAFVYTASLAVGAVARALEYTLHDRWRWEGHIDRARSIQSNLDT